MKNQKKSKTYLSRAFTAPDGREGGIFAVGKEIKEETIKEFTDRGAFLIFDTELNYRTGYDYYRLYLNDGSFVLLQDLD